MTWFKVDDGFWSSSKVLSIPRRNRLAAVGLWTLTGNWCAHELKDGVVPNHVLDELGATLTLRNALVEARLWLDHGLAGIEFVNWSEFQPTREQVETRRESWASRQKRARMSRRDSTEESRVESTVESLSPVPSRPDPSSSTKKRDHASRGSRLSPDWLPSAESVAKAKADAPHVDHKAEHSSFVDYWVAVPGARGLKLDWESTWRNWMRRKEADMAGRRPVKLTPEERARQTLALAGEMKEML